ncbi:hypothetical protein M4J06_005247 [Streptomyces coelicoflavus]|uniref:hypothetical protein n=1 Tax=Streptomyces coelicoflavus TaxID=285562 RepID=UPI002108E666|nr:hypothetical protein [Streptomyces coelicoflavus]MCQ4201182.1 hypothetical protein [Streptomyces coelicoflavus]
MSQTHRGTPCHHGCGCDIRHLVKSAEHGPERDPEHLDNGEMRMLLRAAREVAELVGHNREQLAAARARTIDAHARTEEAVQSLARFEAAASLRTSRVAHAAVESRHAEDGAHDRRRREMWIRVLRWPVIAAMALFDAWYFMRVFQYLTTSEEAVSLAEQTVSFLPGVVLALALMLSGHAIAAPLHRVREWLHALRDRRPGLCLLGSLALPALYLAAVLSSVTVWAVLRARDTGTEEVEGARYAPGWVAVLMLVLAITAVAMKVVAHNPYADSAAEARRGLLRARLTYAWLVRRVGDALREHERAWSDLCALRDELASQVRLESMRVWEAAILTARMVHGQAGHLPPAPAASPGGVETQAPTAAWMAPLFSGVVEPPPELGPLVEAHRIAVTCTPTELRARRTELISRIDCQLGPV